jgi:hypothetical protein
MPWRSKEVPDLRQRLSGHAVSMLGSAVRVRAVAKDCERDASTVDESSERRPGAFMWSMSVVGPRSGVSGRSR